MRAKVWVVSADEEDMGAPTDWREEKCLKRGKKMENALFPWKKFTLKEALSLDEKSLTHCLYAIHDGVNWLYIGISHRLITRLYQHLGIATADGTRLLDPQEAIHLLTEKYDDEKLSNPTDAFWHLEYYAYIWPTIPVGNLGLAILNNRPHCLEWSYYYIPIQLLYPNATETELDKLLASEEKKLIMEHRPLFNKQHNKQSKPGQVRSVWEWNMRDKMTSDLTGTIKNEVQNNEVKIIEVFPAFECLLNEGACLYLDAIRLVEATESLYRRASQFENRARDFDEISQEEVQQFVSRQAEAFIQIGARILDLEDVLDMFIKMYGHEKMAMALKWYYEERRLPEQGEEEGVTGA